MTSFSLFPPRRVPVFCRGVAVALGAALLSGLSSVGIAAANVIDSGSAWTDTDGAFINAHGGGILEHAGTYYWYGEIKRGATTLPDCNASWGGTRVPFVGISCYSSSDLLHWRNEGAVLARDPSVKELREDRVVERPKVIYNARTRQFVMWMHIDSMDYLEAKTGVAVADNPRGPFRLLRSARPNAGVIPDDLPVTMRREFEEAHRRHQLGLWAEKHPDWQVWARDFAGGQMARDMALFVDDDGTAYQFYASEENAVMHVSRLTNDYLQHSGRYRRITYDSREAPAPFKWKGRYYLASSGCTGWDPNPTMLHSAESIMGPWTDHGSLFEDTSSAAGVSFLSQPCFVAPIGGKGLLLMADRWNKHDLQHSRYVWLPVDTSGDLPRVRWLQVWTPDEAFR